MIRSYAKANVESRGVRRHLPLPALRKGAKGLLPLVSTRPSSPLDTEGPGGVVPAPPKPRCAAALGGFVVRLALAVLLISPGWAIRTKAQELKAGAAAEALVASDTMVIGGGIGPGQSHRARGALAGIRRRDPGPHHERIALVACDVLMIHRDVLDRAARSASNRRRASPSITS